MISLSFFIILTVLTYVAPINDPHGELIGALILTFFIHDVWDSLRST